ncbi:MAG: FAD-binding oxidoreductase [Ramlibacter sp.]|uniref:FAD-binding oxidoreductase n=1 Tax=Ramlibacter sp. TaxID=1917967 RepID=UPI0026032509|nr:FAD-binding oxidoreductase [Ramlibacter sp.]MDH4376878.1 FAD-binding oxidoreductase [Ramlibacter sp.]
MSAFRIRVEGGPAFDCGANDNLVSAAERAGWQLPASCRAGACGSCEGEITAGDFVLPGRQGEGALHCGPARAVKLCRARPRSDLTLAPREIAPVDPKSRKPLAAKVLRIDRLAQDVAVLKLRFPAGVRAKFRAGQYLKVLLPDGAERCFSMANPPQANDGVELHVRQLPGGRFSDLVFGPLQPGDAVQVRMPLGEFFVRESEQALLFVAGGTGFAPVQSMVEDLLRRKVQRPITVYFGARTPAQLYPAAVARQWMEQRPSLRWVPVVSDPQPGDGWQGRTGYVHSAVLEDHPQMAGQAVYACGAPGMIEAARSGFVASGLSPDDFHCDAFVPAAEREE